MKSSIQEGNKTLRFEIDLLKLKLRVRFCNKDKQFAYGELENLKFRFQNSGDSNRQNTYLAGR